MKILLLTMLIGIILLLVNFPVPAPRRRAMGMRRLLPSDRAHRT